MVIHSEPADGAVRPLHHDLAEFGTKRRSDKGVYADNLEVDALIVGAGFSGSYLLYELRKQGLKAAIYEAGTGFGGIWRWNCYPGARVDTEVPQYHLNIPEVWKTWTWSTNYPEYKELQAYFEHMNKVLDLEKDTSFETCVTGAEFNEKEGKWSIKTADGRTAKAKFLIIAAGFAAKRWVPDWQMEKFKGLVEHSSFWPPEGVDVKGKRVAVIGTGASGVQISQEWGQQIGDKGQLYVFQRTPNMACPMRRRELNKAEQDALKPFYSEILDYRECTFAGFTYDFDERKTFEVTPEERLAKYEELWEKGGFSLWLAGFNDYLFSEEANKPVYEFWRSKVLPRIKDPKKQKLLAPEVPPHAFGIKRPSLEQNFYEVMSQPNVEIVDISKKSGSGIDRFDETGIWTKDGKHYEVDVVALATGYDATTGGMTAMGLKGTDGTLLQEEWRKASGAQTYLGLTVPKYPNMFHIYGPHGPTAASNGPASVEVQARWIRDAIKMITAQHIKYIDPTPESAKEWKKKVTDLSDAALFDTVLSTYMGSEIPGKPIEQVNYTGGIPAYKAEIRSALSDNFKGFNVVKASA